MSGLDPRRHAFRPDLADERLRGKVTAERFVPGVPKRLIVPAIELHAQPGPGEPATTEVIYGEDVNVFEEQNDWAYVQLVRDGYVGYIAREALGEASGPVPTHRVATLWGYGFKSPDIKSPLRMVLPFGARVAGILEGGFLKLSTGQFMPCQHAAPAEAREPDFVAVAELFTGVPYRWGGKTALGLDCSGLLQVALQASGQASPRDSDMQETELGQTLGAQEWGHLQRGDLIFWRGHTGIMVDGSCVLHANAHHMAVTVEPLADVVARAAARDSQITSIKRRHAPGATLF